MTDLIAFLSSFFSEYEIYFRIFISAFLGLLIGFDRTHKNKPAGVKTYTFVTVASALITIVSIESVVVYGHMHERTMMDPMRLAAQIVSGLGFLGAGLIMKTGFEVKGLTSAAMILFAGGVGIGIGAGFYGIVIFTIITAFLFIRVGGWIEKREHDKLIVKEDKDLSA
ncbi:MgtC/SapB family protein [Paenibacillus sp. PL91]|uniref:MgtC/SapB family protein n=1 Tax=Paenibacillus sp. PL91 TaxID=2729538 RepID=UPI00145C4AB2|nr:MgtC/SapB family protein [Paenibacillus sp. PL91]MBC9200128.1 MgtC/SapB family protein [Paenibacillus sp. PL91]